MYSFTGGEDGGYPFGGLIFDSSGNLYGASAGAFFPGGVAGTDFQVDALRWHLDILHDLQLSQ